MHCFYSRNIDERRNIIILENDELKHFRALRIKDDENVFVTDGNGEFYECYPNNISKNIIELKILSSFPNHNENDYNLILAFSLISDKNRLEFIFEKGTELGVNLFIPLKTERTQKFKFNYERAEAKILSSLKQCKRSVLPVLNEVSDLNYLKENYQDHEKIWGDNSSSQLINMVNKNKLFIIGPEGGFNPEEKKFLSTFAKSTSLSKAVLRTETACISILSKYG